MRHTIFIDTNILLRHLTQDDAVLSPRATKLMEQVARKQVRAYISTLVVHEATYILEYVYEVKRKDIVMNLKKILLLDELNILDVDKDNLIGALDDYMKLNVDFPDAIYKQFAIENNLKIATFDKHFIKIKAPIYLFK